MAKEMEVLVPDIGDFDSVPVIDILVKAGDQVEKEAPLVTLESDKATMDVPAPQAGIVKSIRLKVGDKVKQGSAVLVLETDSGEAASKPASAEPKNAAAEKPQAKAESSSQNSSASAATKPPSQPKSPDEKPAPIAPAKPAEKGGKQEVTVPDIGDFKEVPIIEVRVKDGDVVAKEDTLLTLESDKATLDVPAPAAGTVRGFKLKVGDKVSKGSAICSLEIAAETNAADEPASEKTEPAEKPAPAKKSAAHGEAEAPSSAPGNLGQAPLPPPASPLPAPDAAVDAAMIPHASPSIRKFARELGVDLGQVKGSAPHGRITLEDVQGYVKKSLAAPSASVAANAARSSSIPKIPVIDFAQFGPIETQPLARIRKLSAAHVHRSWLNIPHVTQNDEADITELEAFRKSQSEETGVKLTLLPFIMKAVAKAMTACPEFNASLSPDGESLILKQYLHIGFAADTPNGLVVPVVRDVDQKGIVALAQETAELAKKARDGKLKGDEMRGGCFSISSLGGIGGSHFTPIVNAPEVGILGVSRSSIKPVWDGKAFQPRLMVPLSLSYDHRVIDGAYAARFIVQLVKLLADLRRLSL
jgi:pyruvate dehydrogenase E2 component (dihydrolipoamide acetyltransferase)